MAKIRLDKYISTSLVISRKDAIRIIKNGQISVDGKITKSGDEKIDDTQSCVLYDGKEISFSPEHYIMLNKPKGLICSTDFDESTVLSLFDKSYHDKGLFPCGRLDKDTTGLLIMTTDGELAHRLLSPKKHAEKLYFVVCDKPFTNDDITLMRDGIMMDGKKTKPANLEVLDTPNTAHITLTEGKYHEIKRLCYACGQKEVVELKRLSFGGVLLDESLKEGKWRKLTDEEIMTLKQN